MTRRAHVESVATQLSLVYGVVPRAVAGSLRASRRPPSGLVPPTPFAARQVGEMALDELCIAAFSLVKPRPHTEDVEDGVLRAVAHADAIAALGIEGVHRTPAPARFTKRTTLHRAGVTFDAVRWESRPGLGRLGGIDGGDDDHAVARILQHPGEPRPWVLWTHGAGQGMDHDLRVFRARWMHEELGINLAFPVQPLHGPRRAGHDGEPGYPGFDVLSNLAHVVRAVSDVRALLGWIVEQGAPGVAAVGVSLGSPVTALTAHLEPAVDSVALVVPMLDMHGTMAYHVAKSAAGRRHAELLRSAPVQRISSVVDPLATTPHAAPHLRTIIAAQNDRMASARAARRLHDRWGGTLAWYPGGHVGHVFSTEVRDGVEAHLDRWLASVDV